MSTILIADDSEIIRKFFKALVSVHGDWTVLEAADGQEAVECARQLKPDLIVLDVTMPVLNGLHACAEILKFTPNTPIVLYTLYKNAEIGREARRLGARSVISKTEDSAVLLQCLEELSKEAAAAPAPASLPSAAQVKPAAVSELPLEQKISETALNLDAPDNLLNP
jgi:CheY-like chemotaxis protein